MKEAESESPRICKSLKKKRTKIPKTDDVNKTNRNPIRKHIGNEN